MNFFEKEKPIGVFDSGIGGLTVVRQLLGTLPNENIVYFGDTARVPYGSKSNETVIEYSIQAAQFLMKKNVKAIVVACNTASSVALPALKEKFQVPIIGMIEPGSKMSVESTRNNKIGVIGTRTTINSNAYSKAIKKINPQINVIEKACPLFVPLVEEGWLNHKATYEITEEYLKELNEYDIDTLVLGCTHYPILSKVIQEIIGKEVQLIDSGIAAAILVKEELIKFDLLSNSYALGNYDFYLSDFPVKFQEIAEMFLGRKIKEIFKIDLEQLINL
ncbi:MAG: glutamate racemase [Ignavibacterium sp.]